MPRFRCAFFLSSGEEEQLTKRSKEMAAVTTAAAKTEGRSLAAGFGAMYGRAFYHGPSSAAGYCLILPRREQIPRLRNPTGSSQPLWSYLQKIHQGTVFVTVLDVALRFPVLS